MNHSLLTDGKARNSVEDSPFDITVRLPRQSLQESYTFLADVVETALAFLAGNFFTARFHQSENEKRLVYAQYQFDHIETPSPMETPSGLDIPLRSRY